jgi:cystathionine beta-lyase
MSNDFNRLISRYGTGSLKWDYHYHDGRRQRWNRTDPGLGSDQVLPLWVADMDFPSPPEVIAAVEERARQGIFGYTDRTPQYDAAVAGWMRRRMGWAVETDWICPAPGVVPAINQMVRTLAPPGGKVIVQPPVYYPFFGSIRNNGAQIAVNPLKLLAGRYRMDFEDLAAKAADPAACMVILCSPHNPVGRVWSPQELQRFGAICAANDLLIVADEIHADLMLGSSRFTPLLVADPELADRTLVCTAPSKTFNLAGLHTANILIPEPRLRRRFQSAMTAAGLGGLNPFGATALEAAYTHGEPWLAEVLAYIESNLDLLADFLIRELPDIDLVRPEGTYLAWLDCRRLGLDHLALEHLMLERARVYLDEGYIFGQGGEGFERINLACPRSLLQRALDRIRDAVAQ